MTRPRLGCRKDPCLGNTNEQLAANRALIRKQAKPQNTLRQKLIAAVAATFVVGPLVSAMT